ncbi:centlein-like isoform X2 [Acanthaster planci]|uniref:Centlein-like isoform X2 n=1 Tax=Acanthaster planci TaxID=133434 RepID=A0A8B7ZDH6_ACAPL|nr:centlein-like isoform X2 [Acanthaster planci]
MTSSELSQLQAQNRALSEELSQCQADKEFVWSLWKRLQVANPDVTQAISLVVQREKEKAELKDRKVLEILQIKDDRIAELERLLSQQQDELKGFVSRKIEVDDEKKKFQKENQLLKEKQLQLEQLLQSKDVRLKNTEVINKETLEKLQNEKKECERQITSVTIELEKEKQSTIRLQATNLDFQNKIKDLEKDIEAITQTAQKAAREEDGHLQKMKELEGTVRRLQEELRKKRSELVEQQKESSKLRKEISDIQTTNSKAMEHANQQADVIQQLQTLQFDTQKVLKNQEDAHKIEVSSFQMTYQELQSRYKASRTSEQQLRQRLSEAERQLSQRKATKDIGIQVNLVVDGRVWERSDEEREAQMQRRSFQRHQWERDDLDDRYRAVSSTPIKGSLRRSRSLSPRRPYSYQPDPTMRDEAEEIAFRDFKPGEEHIADRRIADLRKLLKLKNSELDEMRSAHTRRLERLKALQASYNVLKEQIKTYDAEERDPPKKKKGRRSEQRKLQKEDSDAVWNELAYFKQQTVNVLQERMNLHEELDCLRVQTASDATTIKELTACLEKERQELEGQLSQLQEANRREKTERDQALELRDKVNELQRLLQRLEREKDGLTRDKSRLETENRSLRMGVSKQRAVEAQKESKMLELRGTINHLKKKLKHLKQRQRHTVGGMSFRRSKMTKEHQALLNRSIQEMSSIFPGFGSDDWDEMNNSDSPKESTSLESLGQQIVETSRSADMFHTPRRRRRGSDKLSPSARQLLSIQKHLRRMAQAYEDNPVRDVILKSVATQTERVLQASMIDAGVGEYLINDDVISSVTPNSTASCSTMTDNTLTEQSDTELRDVGTSPHVPLTRLARNISRRSQGAGASGPSLASLKQRVTSLQQQVSLLKESKTSLQRTVTEQEELTEQLQSDLNLANQRLKMSRQTVQRLTSELEESNQRRALFEKQLEEGETEFKKQAETERKQMETRLKAQSGEVSRQATIIKSLKADLEARDVTVKALQEKVSRQDRDISQKRSLIDDLKARARSIDSDNKVATRATEILEDRITALTETNEKRRVEIDSIRKQLSTVSKEKRHYEQLYMKCKTELDRKVKSLQDAHVKLAEAETISTELEVTAGQQLKQLARQTEVALEAAKSKLKKTQAQNAELQDFVKVCHQQPWPHRECVTSLHIKVQRPRHVLGLLR